MGTRRAACSLYPNLVQQGLTRSLIVSTSIARFAGQLAIFGVLALTVVLASSLSRCSNEVGAVHYAVSLQLRWTIGSPRARQCGVAASKSHYRPLPMSRQERFAAPKRRWRCVLEAHGWTGELGVTKRTLIDTTSTVLLGELREFCGNQSCSVVLSRDDRNGRPTANLLKLNVILSAASSS